MDRYSNLTFLTHVDIECAKCNESFPCLRGNEREYCNDCQLTIEEEEADAKAQQAEEALQAQVDHDLTVAIQQAQVMDTMLRSIFPTL